MSKLVSKLKKMSRDEFERSLDLLKQNPAARIMAERRAQPIDRSRLLATSKQDGYTLRVFAGSNAPNAVGTEEIESPDGVRVRTANWMDKPEEHDHWPSKEDYEQLPVEDRAQLEAHEQLLWGLKRNFQSHSSEDRVLESENLPEPVGGRRESGKWVEKDKVKTALAPVQTGPRGGHFVLGRDGTKHYMPGMS